MGVMEVVVAVPVAGVAADAAAAAGAATEAVGAAGTAAEAAGAAALPAAAGGLAATGAESFSAPVAQEISSTTKPNSAILDTTHLVSRCTCKRGSSSLF
jgi:hypothetical protein